MEIKNTKKTIQKKSEVQNLKAKSKQKKEKELQLLDTNYTFIAFGKKREMGGKFK